MTRSPLFLLRSILLTGIALAVPATAARPAVPARLGLHQIVEKALAANPGLLAASQADRGARLQARAAALTRLGRLEGIVGYSRYKDDQILRPISRQLLQEGLARMPFDDEQLHYGIAYELPLYLGGRLNARIRLARLTARQASAMLEGSRWQVRFNATSLYAGAVVLDSTAAAVEELLRALDQTRKRLDLMVSQGKRPEVDRLKVLERLAEARAQRARVAADSARVRGLLAALLDLPAPDSLALAPWPAALPRLDLPPDQVQAALAGVSAVRTAELAVRRARAAEQMARADFLPSISVRANAFRHDGRDLDRDPLDTWEVTVGAKLPLFTGGSRVAELGAARARVRAAHSRLVQVRLQQKARLEAALARFRAAHTAVRAARDRVKAAEEAARIEQIRYDTGAGTIEDLLRVRSREQKARAGLARAIGDVWIAAAQINTLVEKEIIR